MVEGNSQTQLSRYVESIKTSIEVHEAQGELFYDDLIESLDSVYIHNFKNKDDDQ